MVLIENIETKKISAYTEIPTQLTSKNKCKLFYSHLGGYNYKNPFNLSEYRKPDGYTGAENANKAVKELKKMKNAHLYNIFISRIGSKKCPVKVKIAEKDFELADFILK